MNRGATKVVKIFTQLVVLITEICHSCTIITCRNFVVKYIICLTYGMEVIQTARKRIVDGSNVMAGHHSSKLICTYFMSTALLQYIGGP